MTNEQIEAIEAVQAGYLAHLKSYFAEWAAQRIEAGTDETPQEVRPVGREPGPQSGCARKDIP